MRYETRNENSGRIEGRRNQKNVIFRPFRILLFSLFIREYLEEKKGRRPMYRPKKKANLIGGNKFFLLVKFVFLVPILRMILSRILKNI